MEDDYERLQKVIESATQQRVEGGLTTIEARSSVVCDLLVAERARRGASEADYCDAGLHHYEAGDVSLVPLLHRQKDWTFCPEHRDLAFQQVTDMAREAGLSVEEAVSRADEDDHGVPADLVRDRYSVSG